MTPDGVMALKPTTFANHFYLLANGSDGEQVRAQRPRMHADLEAGATFAWA